MTVCQGDVLRVEGIRGYVFVASTNVFNETGAVIACPLLSQEREEALHIKVSGETLEGVVVCEQMKFLDLTFRGYSKIDTVEIRDIMEVTDAIQGIFDYI